MKRLSLIAGVAALLSAVVVLVAGSAGASAATVLHFTYSHNWQGDTFVAFDTSRTTICPVFPGEPDPTFYPSYSFSDVNLTDQVTSTYIAYRPPLWRMESIGTVSGVIYAADGSYTVTSGTLKENRVGDIAFSFFKGSGLVTISGPGGTLTGRATFTDLSQEDSQSEGFLFTNVISCQLN